MTTKHERYEPARRDFLKLAGRTVAAGAALSAAQLTRSELALPALQEAGDRWAHGDFSLAREHLLSQAIRRAGRTPLAVPGMMMGMVGRGLNPRGMADFSPEAVRYLTYGRALDTTAMRSVLGFDPAYTSEEAFEAFAHPGRSEVDVA